MVFFLYFLRTVWFVMKFRTYILDNAGMVVRLNGFIGGWGGWREGGCPLIGAILSLVSLEEGAYFQYFSLFLEKGSVCFHEIFQQCSWYYSGNHTKNNMPCCFRFSMLF